MGIPTIYRNRQDPLINYNFTDLIQDVGYITLYGMQDEEDNYRVTPNTDLESTNSETRAGFTADGTDQQVHDIDFDYEFFRTAHVKGVLFITFTGTVDGSAGNAATAYWKIKIVHYDGSTETVIGTQQTTDDVTNPASTNRTYERITCAFDVDKKFKKGEILRVSIETWGNSGAGAPDAGFYHDAYNDYLSGQSLNSNFIINIPFSLSI